ncbi:MAG: DUF349 domain-containing protein [Clostridium sp.]
MYNDHDEFEVNDYDEDIRRREALIEEAKNIEISSDWNTVFREISDLKRKWKRIPYWDSAYEETLMEQFDGYMDAFYAKRREGYESNQAIKQELIERARSVSVSNNWNQATEEMNELMQQWKASGTAGKESDDALWEEFNAARQTFFDRKHEHWENMQTKFSNAKEVKEALIAEAAALADSIEWNKTGEKFRVMMDQWKAAGSAGREHEDRLWNAFNESRQKFYDKRSAYYDQLHEQQDGKYEEKRKLVERAAEIAQRKEYTRENTDVMKNLSKEWKGIGSCGKEREDEIWKEFRAVMDSYFDGLRNWNEQRHAQWRQRMQEARARKQELILDQQRQIKHMQEEIVGLIGQRAIDDMEDRIEDKKEFIRELEEELADIDKSLGK